jgi:hypothetical protein
MKFLTTIVLLIGMVALLPAQKVKVTSPKDGDVWILGTTKLITWEANGYTGNVFIEIGNVLDSSIYGNITPSPLPPAAAQQYAWKVGQLTSGAPTLPEGSYRLSVINVDEGIWSHSGTFTIIGLYIKPEQFRFIEYRWPPLPDPCLCPEFDLKPLKEVFGFIKIPISIVLMKNGQQVQQLASFAKGAMLPASLKAQLSKVDFDMLKSGRAKFTLAVLGARGKILSEHGLQLQRQTKLR